MLINKKYILGILTIALCLGYAAYSTTFIKKNTTAPSQVLAQVGNSEISLLQLQRVYDITQTTKPSDSIRKEMTDKLINRELAVQQALANKLDQHADVMLQLEEARRDVLALAYAKHIAATAAKPSDNDTAHYYNQHPELFSQRKIFQLNEITLSNNVPKFAEIKAILAKGTSLNQFKSWLQEQKIPFNSQNVIRAAEQLPIEALPKLNQAKLGDQQFFESPRGLIVYTISNTQTSPITWEQAKPIIFDYLTKQAGKLAVNNELDHLRRITKIQAPEL
jgi:peptidyl-prolyl cis-trans isomerase, EpsD family